MSVKRRLVELTVVGAAFAALGFVFAQTPEPPGAALPATIAYHGERYDLALFADSTSGETEPSCFVHPADVPHGHAPFDRVGIAVFGHPRRSHPILVPRSERHGRVPFTVYVRDGGCLREYRIPVSTCGSPYTFAIGTRVVVSGSCSGILRGAPTVRARRGKEFSLVIMGESAGPRATRIVPAYPVPRPSGSAVVITAVRGQFIRYRVKATGRTQLRVKSEFCSTYTDAATCPVLTIIAG